MEVGSGNVVRRDGQGAVFSPKLDSGAASDGTREGS